MVNGIVKCKAHKHESVNDSKAQFLILPEVVCICVLFDYSFMSTVNSDFVTDYFSPFIYCS